MFALLFAFLSPITWAIVNVIDKYVIDHRIKSVLGFTAICGVPSIVASALIAPFLDWSGVSLIAFVIPVVSGILIAAWTYYYMIILEKEDISHLVGFMYVYPLVVAFLAFLFLGERLSLLGYFAVLLVIIGVTALSLRLKKITLKTSVWFIVVIVLITGVNEFLMKISSANIGAWQGTIIFNGVWGIALLFGFLHPEARKHGLAELVNLPIAAILTFVEMLSVLFLYLAMAGLPATVVSSIGAIQPLFVLGFEWLTHRYVSAISRDEDFKQKLIAILLIAAGVLVLTVWAI